ncbi:MAG: hypothetical protein ABL907_12815 [Hyphomicrobium sp.]
MRAFLNYLGLVLLMVAARYAPLEQAGSAVAWLWKKAPSPIVTGSVTSSASLTGRPAPQPASSSSAAPPVQAAMTSKFEGRVRTILAEAGSLEEGSKGGPRAGGSGESAKSGSPKRSASDRAKGANTQDAVADEIQMGGTGLLDEVPVADPHAKDPLVVANPDSFIVLCEAGCRPSSDRIVYKVSKVAASSAAIAQRRLELTGASTSDVSGNVASADNTIVCVAGCYDEPAARKTGAKRADNSPAQSLAKSLVKSPAVEAVPRVVIADADTDRLSRRETQPEAPAPIEAVSDAKAATVDAMPRPKLADVHLISRETHGRRVMKHVKAVALYSERWRTTVTLIADKRPFPVTLKERLAIWKRASTGPGIGPFETTVSTESGWESAFASEQ